MQPSDFNALLIKKFPFSPTTSQEVWMKEITDYLFFAQPSTLFVLKGYAGTGKSTVIGHLVNHLFKISCRAVLMAPTGRAAKVMGNYAGKKAFTIHKHIYFTKNEGGKGMQFTLKPNKFKNTLFVVDEASMIGDDRQNTKLFENGSLLGDLIQYVDAGTNCKLLLVGDPAQLPPVHLELSPALDSDYLARAFNKETVECTLEQVVRQKRSSGILVNATNLRQQLDREIGNDFQFELEQTTDIRRMREGNEILEALEEAIRNDGLEETVFIVRSNKRANLYNQQIRSRILFLDADLSVGDQLMVVKNNYFWLAPESSPGFIANGDLIKILRIIEYKNIYGFRFAKVEVAMVDYPDEKPFDTMLLIDTLTTENPSLSYEQSNQLYQAVQEDYKHLSSKYKRFLAVKNNPYFNALQVKYSYAITCHKSQGGQWKKVFVEQPYLPDGPSLAYYRWLYTALTRAQEQLYLVGFTKEYFLSEEDQ
ncbi:MAG: ATP-dependent DNA helicase [Flavobacteriaceae bacterium]